MLTRPCGNMSFGSFHNSVNDVANTWIRLKDVGGATWLPTKDDKYAQRDCQPQQGEICHVKLEWRFAQRAMNSGHDFWLVFCPSLSSVNGWGDEYNDFSYLLDSDDEEGDAPEEFSLFALTRAVFVETKEKVETTESPWSIYKVGILEVVPFGDLTSFFPPGTGCNDWAGVLPMIKDEKLARQMGYCQDFKCSSNFVFHEWGAAQGDIGGWSLFARNKSHKWSLVATGGHFFAQEAGDCFGNLPLTDEQANCWGLPPEKPSCELEDPLSTTPADLSSANLDEQVKELSLDE